MIATDYIFGRKSGVTNGTEINTYIGGISALYPTAQSLATALNITAVDIPIFNIIGNNIECRIVANYNIPIGFGHPNITYYLDEIDGKALSHGGFLYYNGGQIREIKCKNVTAITQSFISGNNFFQNIHFPNLINVPDFGFRGYQLPTIREIYIPNVLNLGASALNNGCFNDIDFTGKRTRIIANPALSTNNAGGMDGDLSFAQTNGALILFPTNQNRPRNPVFSDLTMDYKFIKFKTYSHSNTILYYEVYNNGNWVKDCFLDRDDYFDGLEIGTTYSNYSFRTVDNHFNKSDLVPISFTTKGNAEANVEITNLASYYLFEETSLPIIKDRFNHNNFTEANASFHFPQSEGKINFGLKNTGNAFVRGLNAAFGITSKLTVNFWYKRNAGGAGGNRTIFDWGAKINNVGFGIWINTTGQLGIRVNGENAAFRPEWVAPLDTWIMVTVSYDSAMVKMYLNGNLVYSYAKTIIPVGSNQIYLFRRAAYAEWTPCHIDELSIWNEAISAVRIAEWAGEDPNNPGTYLGKSLI